MTPQDTPREAFIRQQVAAGVVYREIGRRLGISYERVRQIAKTIGAFESRKQARSVKAAARRTAVEICKAAREATRTAFVGQLRHLVEVEGYSIRAAFERLGKPPSILYQRKWLQNITPPLKSRHAPCEGRLYDSTQRRSRLHA